nr:immunoglobulin heavy chain junction region [Macaca mulatta]MOW88422.1 immunoglobulin heavy chain junction region [Macaca mulatta]MOW90324.1 immunoglobulin heavy chain junction region [Macaca mulatta]MOW90831.1 immunoglobulin heavy chain junction region [Macaca mulatta]MOW91250.1 immunoglobulin heavy chain junction region [Macaca mulatta]
CARVHSNFDYW